MNLYIHIAYEEFQGTCGNAYRFSTVKNPDDDGPATYHGPTGLKISSESCGPWRLLCAVDAQKVSKDIYRIRVPKSYGGALGDYVTISLDDQSGMNAALARDIAAEIATL